MSKAKLNPPLGAPPSIEWKAVGDLEVDLGYQRAVTDGAGKSLISAIAENWDWRLCAPLTVSRRVEPAGFFVIDGQHRLMAARARGDIPHLPCIISTFQSIADEAKCFVAVNTKRRPVSPIETFKAALASGDAKAVQVNDLITRAGLSVAPHSNHTAWRPLQISALAGVRNSLSRYGETATLAALEDQARAHPEEVLRYSGRILAALYAIHGTAKQPLDRARLVATLAARPQSGWFAQMLRRQAKHGELPESAMQYAILDDYGVTR